MRIKRNIVEIVETWNLRIADVTRKKDNDKKKDKIVSVDIDNASAEESFMSTESLENKNISRDKDVLSKKVKSLDSSDSM